MSFTKFLSHLIGLWFSILIDCAFFLYVGRWTSGDELPFGLWSAAFSVASIYAPIIGAILLIRWGLLRQR